MSQKIHQEKEAKTAAVKRRQLAREVFSAKAREQARQFVEQHTTLEVSAQVPVLFSNWCSG